MNHIFVDFSFEGWDPSFFKSLLNQQIYRDYYILNVRTDQMEPIVPELEKLLAETKV